MSLKALQCLRHEFLPPSFEEERWVIQYPLGGHDSIRIREREVLSHVLALPDVPIADHRDPNRRLNRPHLIEMRRPVPPPRRSAPVPRMDSDQSAAVFLEPSAELDGCLDGVQEADLAEHGHAEPFGERPDHRQHELVVLLVEEV
eukprot:CAMPEP_0114502630 /NCGR_PEP_ID=MMETSP0109-20121206/9202_1 /TAXON_ID=29199 /ORGANISM="Chlorarachnion reptans, Strain CCCM449" /LENGTH=144 /DNA_ID=CAMNT_0001680575 /DNA_START=1070 /DNA_END=1504 /DNA_ORIENTATION=-